jgi:hypothetical protein
MDNAAGWYLLEFILGRSGEHIHKTSCSEGWYAKGYWRWVLAGEGCRSVRASHAWRLLVLAGFWVG